MSENRRSIEVFADWVGLDGPTRLGTLLAHETRGKELFSFEYDDDWLARHDERVLDPELRLFRGAQYAGLEKPNFGLFLDSSPDRWGRVLMRRREAIHARKEGRASRRLGEADFLLGVYDLNRLGALRFKERGGESFQSSDSAMAAPPWSKLRDLEYASFLAEREDDDEKLDPWLAMLMAPGSSLGGARPKASVLDERGDLWIAKFPGKSDMRDVGAWELLAADIAGDAGVSMSVCRRASFSTRGTTFLTKRFDRLGERRVHFASAMTLLGRKDGDDVASGASYLELAEFIMRFGSRPEEDLAQLWRRIVLAIAISNTDDHLRNHGFLMEDRGWRLSPAYDLNPDPESRGLSLAIDEHDNSLDFDLALSAAKYFRLSMQDAREILVSITTAVSSWRKRARALGISAYEIESMAAAFRPR